MDFKFNGILPKNVFVRKGRNGEFKRAKECYGNDILIWSAEQPVTYVIDGDNQITIDVEYGADCTNYIPEMIEGYDYFVGWSIAHGTIDYILSSKIVESEPITLYAVFGRDITCTFISYRETIPVPGTVLYNNGTVFGVSMELPLPAQYGDWNFAGWGIAGDNTANGVVMDESYDGMIHHLLENNIYYAKYQKNITCSFVSYDKTESKSCVAYYCDDVTVGGSIMTPTPNDYESGWSVIGWGAAGDKTANDAVLQSQADGTVKIDNIISNNVYYAKYKRNVVLYYNGNAASGSMDPDYSGIRYMNSYSKDGNYTFSGANFIVKECKYEKPAHSFVDWALDTATPSSSTVRRKPKESLTISWNRTLYAIWKAVKTEIFKGTVKQYNNENYNKKILVGWFDLRKHSSITLYIGRMRSPDTNANIEVYISNRRVFVHENINFQNITTYGPITQSIPSDKKLSSVDIEIRCGGCGRYTEIEDFTLTLNP